MGVSPLAYQRALRAGSLRNNLKQGGSVTDAIYEAGFGSSSRAYEGAALGMTPGRFAQGGRGEQIGWSTALSQFGWILVGATERGLCWLSIAGSEAEAEATLRAEFPAAELHRDAALAPWVEAALATVQGGEAARQAGVEARSAWHGLSVAGVAGAARDSPRRDAQLQPIGAGDGRSQVHPRRGPGLRHQSGGMVVPCHRVVGVSGSLTGYRWGVERKRQLLESEHAMRQLTL